ncbi:Piso0_002375 [Millerozyma farinosa CBS 7064]|uniref:Ribosome-recycling factor, mitochondrial n=1 Tax=Pichia sorbitophila (strain ATCC MYA-4447 / BCRC 22081 / CBS 7064 / NBRC 10061 / NRRL Y-12695) TaxID=559304 RepID=G8YCG0_PICSO|nr:Piso0_002375 [Millerozyma farinosa CBS 7064]
MLGIFRSLTGARAYRGFVPHSRVHYLRSSQFHTALVLSKKAKVKSGISNKAKKDGQVEKDTDTSGSEASNIDFDDANAKFTSVLEKFKKHANDAKLGKTNPDIFDKLTIGTSNGDVPFNQVAQSSIKGRNFVITVFDPSNTQSIVNSVLASDLNMNPQVDPANKSTLKVPLPPVTTESKKENTKQLKAVFEKFKNGGKVSLASVRSDFRNKFQKQSKKKRLSDEEEQVWKDFEKLHKEYTDKLNSIYKEAEQKILK